MNNREFPFNRPIHPEDNRSINKAFDRNYGNRIKSGDTTPLKYTIKDGDGEPLDKERLLAMDVTAILKYEDIVAYETEAIVTLEDETENYAGDLVARFTIQEALAPSATPYILEFHFEDGESSDRFIFPSANNLDIYITPSALNSDEEAIKKIGEERLKEVVESSQTLTDIRSQEQERIAAETARQTNYLELVETGVVRAGIDHALAQHEQTYAPRLTSLEQNDAELTAQLAHNENRPYTVKNIQSTSSTPKPIVVFTFDDGAKEDIEVMKPIFDAFGYKFTTFIIAGLIGQSYLENPLMDINELKLLYEDGHEIGSHTMTHIGMGSNPPETVDYEMRESKRILESLGFEVNNFAYPFGDQDNVAQRTSLKYYRTSSLFMSGSEPNRIPINKSGIHRISLGSHFDPTTQDFPITDTFNDYYKHWVDDAIENNRLTVFALHPWEIVKGEEQMTYLQQTLQYCQNNDVNVMTLNEALNYFDNTIDIKVFNEDSTLKSELMVDANGNLSSRKMLFTTKGRIVGFTGDSKPSEYPSGVVSRMNIPDDGLSLGFPYNYAVLYTERHDEWLDDMRQVIFNKWDNGIKYRSALPNDTWTNWSDIVQNTFVLLAYKPVPEGRDILPKEKIVFNVPNSETVWRSVAIANAADPLSAGIFYRAYNYRGTGIKLEIENLSDATVYLPPDLEFNIKAM